jgi:hypothetical protein
MRWELSKEERADRNRLMTAKTAKVFKKISRKLPAGVECRAVNAPDIPARILIFGEAGLQSEEICRAYITFSLPAMTLDKVLFRRKNHDISLNEAKAARAQKIQSVASGVFSDEGFLKKFPPGARNEATRQIMLAENDSLFRALKGVIGAMTGNLPENVSVLKVEVNAGDGWVNIRLTHGILGYLGCIKLVIFGSDRLELCPSPGHDAILALKVEGGYSGVDDGHMPERQTMMTEIIKAANEFLAEKAESGSPIASYPGEESVMVSDFYGHSIDGLQEAAEGDSGEMPAEVRGEIQEETKRTILSKLSARYSRLVVELSKMPGRIQMRPLIHSELPDRVKRCCVIIHFIHESMGELGIVDAFFDGTGLILNTLNSSVRKAKDGFDEERDSLMGKIFQIALSCWKIM